MTTAAAPDNAALFSRLVNHYQTTPDRRGWVIVTCPNCGKENHFAFSQERGSKCVVCGVGYSLKQLTAKVIGDDLPPIVFKPIPQPEPKHYAWMDDLPDYLEHYEADSNRFQAWKAYRGLTPEMVKRYHLGVGTFPPFSSQCDHERLMVPMLQNGAPIAFRGRSIDACNHKKWLSTSMGGKAPLLYNGGVLLPAHERGMVGNYDLTDSLGAYCRGRVLYIVENPVDCLLLESAGLCVVATLGVSMWTQSRPWTQLLKLAKPKAVVVMYDHDLPGNGAGDEREYQRMAEAWRAEHHAEPPVSNGVRLANELNAAGVPASRFHWPVTAPVKADPGWLIERVGLSRIAGAL